MNAPPSILRAQPHRALVTIRGAERVEFVNRMCTNDARKVAPALGIPAVLTTAKGRVVDAVRVFARGDELALLGSAGQGERLKEWLGKYVVMEELQIDVAAGEGVLLALGPQAVAAAKKVLGVELPAASGGFAVASASFDGATLHLLGPGEAPFPGLEIVGPAAALSKLRPRLLDAGLAELDDAGFETRRVEEGIPLLGRELTENVNPLEASLPAAVSFTKGCYIGQEVVARLNSYSKVQRHLVGVKFQGEVDPASVSEIFWELLRIGNATSATRSTRLGATLALAFVKTEYAKPGTPVYAVREGEHLPGTLSELPFR
jgi:folate-binding protein YgfZ